MSTSGRTALGDGRWINWQSDGSGETVLLLHGITEDLHAWDTFVPELSRTARIVRMDLPGHGESSPLPQYSVFSLASAVADFIAATHLESPRLIGHSLGGIVATVVASMCPVRSVINVDQSLRLGSFIDVVRGIAAELADERFCDAMNQEMETLAGPALPAPVREELRRYRVPERQKVVTDLWLPIVEQTEEEVLAGFLPTLGKVRVPYLSLHGEAPGEDYAAWLASVIPGARTEIWPGLGHWLHRVEPHRFLERVRIFHANH
jgi:pimeloyl-ACP methyl ester carboxylesterase